MNALTAPTTTPIGAAAMVPRNMREAMEMATMMARTGFLAKEIQNPGGALFVMEQSMRWNMSPFAVAMETSFIQGKPMFSGKIVAAAVQSSGVLAGRLSYAYTGKGDDRTVTVSGTIRGEAKARDVTVRLGEAKTNNKVWQSQPDQQLAYHGARVWARRHTPEVMLGVYAPEEFDEAPAQAEPREVPNLAAAPAPPAPVGLPILAPDGSLRRISPGNWLAKLGEALAKLESSEALRKWRTAMVQHLVAVAETDEMLVVEAERLIEDRLAEMSDAEAA
jgi:hypothetical protein